ncbi:hypothetical protein RHOSPDRAFT_34431 [Rhodotorula sp. JG-1b]|nr:hypothetical protein RHOSPDRAFT_34431 [Rhodotorula sp. JG-1b]
MLGTLVKIIDLIALGLLVVFTGVYLWPSFSNFQFTTDLAIIGPWWSLAGSAAAIVFVLISFCTGVSMECGILLGILAVLNIIGYIIWAVKGNPGTICDGAAGLADKAGAANMVNCGISWIKYAIYALLVTAGLSQLAVAAMGFPCAGGGGGGPQNALGKSPGTTTITTARSLGRGARERRGDKHRWAKLADAEHDAEGRADYPLRRSKETAGYSETDPSGSSDSDEQQWKSRKRSAF